MENYEHKYKEAIESIKRIYEQADSYGKELMKKEFPELKEFEDEKIRKEILSHFNRILCGEDVEFPPQDSIENWIAWLEKQGEQNTIVNKSPSDECPCCGWELDSDGCCSSCGYGRK